MTQKNTTCDISRLPIFEGDKIIVIPIRLRKNAKPTSHLQEIDDNWRIFTMPFEAEYDGYGGIRNAQITQFDMDFWNKFEGPVVPTKAYDKRGYYVELEKKKLNITNSQTFDNFFNAMFLAKEVVTYSALMIHKDLYWGIINNIGSRMNPEKDTTYKQFWIKQINYVLSEFNESVEKYFIQPNDLTPHMQSFFKVNTLSILSHHIMHNFANKLVKFGHRMMTPDDTKMTYDFDEFSKKMQGNYRFHVCNYFLQQKLNNQPYDPVLIERLAEVNMLATAFNLLHMGYMGNIHYHKSNEMKLHMIIAQFITTYTQNYVKNMVMKEKASSKKRDDYIMDSISFKYLD